MTRVSTPDGYGEVLREQSVRGKTSYLVRGASFEGWYDGLEVTADFADQPDDVIPNDDNETILPYPSRPQGPGWDGTTSTIQPDVDPHLEMGGASDSLTGESTSEDPVDADIEGLFEPPSRLAGVRRRVHFAAWDDSILDVSALPEESPAGLDNSPINPDGVDTDDLFNGESFESRTSSYDRLVIEDDLSFMRYAADDDKKKHHHERDGQPPWANDKGDDDSDDDSSADAGGGDSNGGDGDGGGSHTAALALTTTADLHFLANLCSCATALPLHSKSEHRELQAEAGTDEVDAQPRDLNKELEKYEQEQHTYQESNLSNLVDNTNDDGDSADLYNHYASVNGHKISAVREVDGWLINEHGQAIPKTAAPAADPNAQPTQIESQIEQLMQFWAVDNNGWWHWTGSQGDLALLNQMQQQMMAVGMPQGQPGAMQAQSKTAAPALLAALPEIAGAGAAVEGAGAAAGAEGGVAGAEGGGALKNMMGGGGGGGGGTSPAAAMGSLAQGVQGLFGSNGDSGVAHHGVPFKTYGFAVEENVPSHWREYLQTVASDRLVALAAWADVVQKSKRLRVEGAITVEAFRPDVITAYVQGDNGKYYTTVQRLGSVAPGVGRQLTSTQVSGWSCSCEWGQWAWLRKRSFVGRMCSHAYALFNEMRSLDAKSRKNKGKPKTAGVSNRTSWIRTRQGGFEWVSDDPGAPTAAIVRHEGLVHKSGAVLSPGWFLHVWPDGGSEDSLHAGNFQHSGQAQRVAARIINAHIRLAESGDVDLVGDGDFSPGESTGYDNTSPYSDDGAPEPLIEEQSAYDEGPGPGIQEGKTRTGSISVFAERDDGQDDEGPEETDEGIEEEDPNDEESLDEEIAEDEGNSEDDEDQGDSDDDESYEHNDSDENDETNNPGDESDDDGIEKQSVVGLQVRHGLNYLAGANYSLAEQDKLVREGEGKIARNRDDLSLTGTHYEATREGSVEDPLTFLF